MDRTIAWTPTRAAALPATVLASPAAFAGYSLAPYVNYPAGNWAEAVAIGDVNGDGRNDAVLTTAAYDNYNTYIYLQSPDGTLATPVKTSHFSSANRNDLALGDLDHDGRDDIVVGHESGITITRWDRSAMGWSPRGCTRRSIRRWPGDADLCHAGNKRG